jgi:hypothetical protein
MTTLSTRIADLIRAWLGLTAIPAMSLTPAHGWLLPTADAARALRLTRRAVPTANGCGR